MPAEVFISYSSKDKKIADAVCHYLEERSIRCWIAPRDVQHGREWADVIVEAIAGCKLIVLVFSSSANDSPIVKREILLAVNKEIVIIPFRIENVLPERSMELFISANHWLDAISPPVEKHIKSLTDNVENLLSGRCDSKTQYDPIKEIDNTAAKWVSSGCPYHMLEGINQQLKLLVRQPPDDIAVKDSDTLMMLLMAALHFGGDWAFWVRKNEGSKNALQQLLIQLNIDYYRPRFRALYALQSYDVNKVKSMVNEVGDKISQGNKSIIEKYVYSRSIPEYLEKISKGADAEIAKRASAVLNEIGRYSGTQCSRNGTKSELPML